MDQLDFSDFFTTKPGASDFAERLSAISQQIYKNDFNLEHALMEQFGLQKKDVFMEVLRNNSIAVDSPQVLKDFFDNLRARIIVLPVVTITIAFEPREETLQKLAQWFLLQLNMQMLFDIIVNPEMIAGTAISFKGKRVDFSIRPVFDTIIKTMLAETSPAKTQSAIQPSALPQQSAQQLPHAQ